MAVGCSRQVMGRMLLAVGLFGGADPANASCGTGMAGENGLAVLSGRYGPVDNVAANANPGPEKQACNHAYRVIRPGLYPEGPHKQVAGTTDHAFNEELKKKAPGNAGHSSQCAPGDFSQ
jgi:hypothetical protein